MQQLAAGAARPGDASRIPITVTDLMSVMERDPLYCKSGHLYSLYATANLPTKEAGGGGAGGGGGGGGGDGAQ
jgi:hypothetical protein